MRMRDDFSPAIRPEFDRLRVVLVRSRNPLNIGAAARAMSNFGFAHLRVVTPYGPAFREARSAVGAADVLETAEEYGSVAEAVGDCALVVGTTAVGKRSIQHDDRAARTRRGAASQRALRGERGAALRLGKDRPQQQRLQPLPLVDAHSHLRSEHLHEPGTGGGGVPLRNRSRRRGRSAISIESRGGSDGRGRPAN